MIKSNFRKTLSKYGKSFYWASFFLEKKIAFKAAELYDFCRELDDLADEKKDFKKLNEIKDLLSKGEIKKTNFVDPIFNKIFIDLIEGLISDQKNSVFNSREILIVYSYQVAGTVGLLMSHILKPSSNYANRFAIDLGIGMQLTNISRDVLEDHLMNRHYLPIFSKKNILCVDEIQKEILETLNIADQYYHSGMNGLVYLPFRSHIAIGIAAIIYKEIGKKLIRNEVKWWEGRVYTTKIEKFLLSFKIIPYLFKRLNKKPTHNSDLHKFIVKKLNEKYF